jgi:hypothetical protein
VPFAIVRVIALVVRDECLPATKSALNRAEKKMVATAVPRQLSRIRIPVAAKISWGFAAAVRRHRPRWKLKLSIEPLPHGGSEFCPHGYSYTCSGKVAIIITKLSGLVAYFVPAGTLYGVREATSFDSPEGAVVKVICGAIP